MQSHLQFFTQENLQQLLNKRVGEQRIGTSIQLPNDNWEQTLQSENVRYVILGIPEDIGVRANFGIGGTHTAWNEFLKAFLNTQDNDFINPSNIFILGNLAFSFTETDDITQLRKLTANIDEAVFPIIQKIVVAGKIPIVIGGGHNNAYPIIKGTSLALHKKINCINLDAHADFRAMEGRHSGNGFSYAYQDDFLKKYSVLAMQQAYNNQNIVNTFAQNENLQALYWEDIFLQNSISWQQAIRQALSFIQNDDYGVEIDLDTIENVLSSAQSPIGVSVQQALQYIYTVSAHQNVRYLHLPEGIAKRADGLINFTVGKLLTGLVLSFIKSKNKNDYNNGF